MKNEDSVRCSFCGKTEKQVRLLIEGNNAYICSDCVELCWNVLKAGSEPETAAPDTKQDKN